jgi:hypothetical protein
VTGAFVQYSIAPEPVPVVVPATALIGEHPAPIDGSAETEPPELETYVVLPASHEPDTVVEAEDPFEAVTIGTSAFPTSEAFTV